MVEEKARLETEGLPAILRETVNLPFRIRHYKVVVQTRVLRRWLHEGVSLVEPSDKAHEGQVPFQVRDRLNQDVGRDDVAVLVFGNDDPLLLEDLSLGCLEIVLQEAVVVVLQDLGHKDSHVLALELLVAIPNKLLGFEVGIDDVSNVSWRHRDSYDDCARVVSEELVLVHVVKLVHVV